MLYAAHLTAYDFVRMNDQELACFQESYEYLLLNYGVYDFVGSSERLSVRCIWNRYPDRARGWFASVAAIVYGCRYTCEQVRADVLRCVKLPKF